MTWNILFSCRIVHVAAGFSHSSALFAASCLCHSFLQYSTQLPSSYNMHFYFLHEQQKVVSGVTSRTCLVESSHNESGSQQSVRPPFYHNSLIINILRSGNNSTSCGLMQNTSLLSARLIKGGNLKQTRYKLATLPFNFTSERSSLRRLLHTFLRRWLTEKWRSKILQPPTSYQIRLAATWMITTEQTALQTQTIAS